MAISPVFNVDAFDLDRTRERYRQRQGWARGLITDLQTAINARLPDYCQSVSVESPILPGRYLQTTLRFLIDFKAPPASDRSQGQEALREKSFIKAFLSVEKPETLPKNLMKLHIADLPVYLGMEKVTLWHEAGSYKSMGRRAWKVKNKTDLSREEIMGVLEVLEPAMNILRQSLPIVPGVSYYAQKKLH